MSTHPIEALFGAERRPPLLPVCDHYAGVESRMRKALGLQREKGPVFDLTLDLEDGAPVGQEKALALVMADILHSEDNLHGRVGVRVHPVRHPLFQAELDLLLKHAGDRLAYIMVPKPESLADVQEAVSRVTRTAAGLGLPAAPPVHVLIETHGALRDVFAIAALPEVQSLSFGLMDFVSEHHGAIPAQAMTSTGQFQHPLVMRAKLEIAAAAHCHGKVPSHCVVTEFTDRAALDEAAHKACRELGYTRMWSIHPDQIDVIVSAFAPRTTEIETAADILLSAESAKWAPIRHHDRLHDRASYRYYWTVLERAHRTGQPLRQDVRDRFFSDLACRPAT